MAAAPLPDPAVAGVYEDIERYYTGKVLAHGPTPLGADWTCQPTQELRFIQLLKLCDFGKAFSLNDVGCGYGALASFLARRHRGARVDYLGTDLSQAMVDQAKPRLPANIQARFVAGTSIPRVADYSVASGIFNVKLAQNTDRWTLFIEKTLSEMNHASRLGFAVNFLAPSGIDFEPIAELYRTSVDVWLQYCEGQFNTRVELVENYGMNEFTLLVRR
ncbi:MAG: class I SAM-dependent methyltransferase [Polaromonas sp.]|nr:class I SAM-dependent methyltransferase [Polaromonas sp.]